MLYVVTGTDRERAREALAALTTKYTKGMEVTRITDAHTLSDLQYALQGGGMFGSARAVVCEGVLAHEEMGLYVLERLASFKETSEPVFIYEEKIDAATRKKIEKYAEVSEKYDRAKEREEATVFSLARALERRDKKALWVSYMRELAKGGAPEAIHGVLFWSVKNGFLKAGSSSAQARYAHLVELLAELPHEARREGCELEYALEHFVLSGK